MSSLPDSCLVVDAEVLTKPDTLPSCSRNLPKTASHHGSQNDSLIVLI
jgi:hypothetical protein